MKIKSCHADAFIEHLLSDANDVGGDRDAGQAGAVLECLVPDAGNAVADVDAGQAAAGFERIGSDAGDAVGNRDGRHATISERIIADAGDVSADRDAGQHEGTIEERSVSNTGDWQAIDCVRDVHGPAGAGVTGDSNRAVIGNEIELRFNRSRQNQQHRSQQAELNQVLLGFQVPRNV